MYVLAKQRILYLYVCNVGMLANSSNYKHKGTVAVAAIEAKEELMLVLLLLLLSHIYILLSCCCLSHAQALMLCMSCVCVCAFILFFLSIKTTTYYVRTQQPATKQASRMLMMLLTTTTAVVCVFICALYIAVKCTACLYRSETFDPFLDIAIDIKHNNSVEDALRSMVRPEDLVGANAYKCEKLVLLLLYVCMYFYYVCIFICTIQMCTYSEGSETFHYSSTTCNSHHSVETF